MFDNAGSPGTVGSAPPKPGKPTGSSGAGQQFDPDVNRLTGHRVRHYFDRVIVRTRLQREDRGDLWIGPARAASRNRRARRRVPHYAIVDIEIVIRISATRISPEQRHLCGGTWIRGDVSRRKAKRSKQRSRRDFARRRRSDRIAPAEPGRGWTGERSSGVIQYRRCFRKRAAGWRSRKGKPP